MENLVPDMVKELEPYWADFIASSASGFGDYLVKRGEEVAEALLSVTDARTEMPELPAILKAYRAVRRSAAKHVIAALLTLAFWWRSTRTDRSSGQLRMATVASR